MIVEIVFGFVVDDDVDFEVCAPVVEVEVGDPVVVVIVGVVDVIIGVVDDVGEVEDCVVVVETVVVGFVVDDDVEVEVGALVVEVEVGVVDVVVEIGIVDVDAVAVDSDDKLVAV